MTDNNYKYYFADAPSPLHVARDAYLAKRQSAVENARSFCNDVGATDVFHDTYSGHITGVAFTDEPGKDWRQVSSGSYMPKRNSSSGRVLAERVSALRIPQARDILPPELECSQINGRYMSRSWVGWVGERIFVTIPFGGEGDPFPTEIPDYLKECKRWELEKYRDEFEATKALSAATENSE